jgi:prepilin-type N-terminal cleavage/methylation domain-containing protein
MDGRKGFTLIELLVVIAVIALLMAILLPALGRPASKDVGRCAQNEKNTGLGLFLYANDYDGKLPMNEVDRWLFDVSYWTTDIVLKTGAFDRHIFYCPSWRQRDNIISGDTGRICRRDPERLDRPNPRTSRRGRTTIASWGTSGSSMSSPPGHIRP